MIIAAYNEESIIERKIENCLNIDYPEDLFKVIIVSDGSTDDTNIIVNNYIKQNKQYKQLHFVELPRIGKSGAINKAMSNIKDGIVIFSDANTFFAPDSVKKLVTKFNCAEVGCVSGRLIYKNPDGVISGKGESFYWKYETFLKKLESKIGFVSGANGAIYAIRAALFDPLPQNTINDDFMISMKIVEKGYKSLYAEDSLALENVAPDLKSEFDRHVRDGGGHYIAVLQLLKLLNPILGARSFIYWSHRIFRWAAPFLMITLFIVNYFLIENIFYLYSFYFQVLFYFLALLGLVLGKVFNNIPLIVFIPFYFCNLNLALFLGFLKVITGRQKSTWNSTRRNKIA
jgi:cellulose synthase/poly-beta-1,6-N-acetylglucosamine synthase-like glycosyltransferase